MQPTPSHKDPKRSGFAPLEIDLAELQDARGDDRLVETLRGAEREGARIEREGRQRWGGELTTRATIDLATLDNARRDHRLLSLLAAAEAEGDRVAREGRQRW